MPSYALLSNCFIVTLLLSSSRLGVCGGAIVHGVCPGFLLYLLESSIAFWSVVTMRHTYKTLWI